MLDGTVMVCVDRLQAQDARSKAGFSFLLLPTSVCVYLCYFWLGLRPSSIYQVTRRKWASERKPCWYRDRRRNEGLLFGSGAFSGLPLPACLACGVQDWKSVRPLWLWRRAASSTPHLLPSHPTQSHSIPTSLIISHRLTTSSTTLLHYLASTTTSPAYHNYLEPSICRSKRSHPRARESRQRRSPWSSSRPTTRQETSGSSWMARVGIIDRALECQARPKRSAKVVIIAQQSNGGRMGRSYRDDIEASQLLTQYILANVSQTRSLRCIEVHGRASRR